MRMALNGILNNMMKSIRNLLNNQQNISATTCMTWDVPQVISIQKRTMKQYAVVILNRPITQSKTFITNFWNNALLRMTVDGGTKHWDVFLNSLPEDVKKNVKLPDLISGDFDSVPKDILEKYREKGCKVIHTPDQDYTDFTKALIEIKKYCQVHKLNVEYIIAVAQSSGRLDHILGNIQTLFLAEEQNLLSANMKVFLMTDDALSWLLQPGRQHVISIPEETLKFKRSWCSLVPIGEHCLSVTTTGLKWNLNNHSMRFGVLVSTSNTFDGSDQVTVICSHTLLWSMRIPSVALGK